ncbi:hypothetical protein [Flavobacterium sp.]|uniref:hypothetical protein n=1 Tax=Flavobacterium sp. TaxID=239 RepID=UPI0031DF4C8B
MEVLLEKFKLFIKSVPKEIKEDEKIVKVVFNPLNINAKGNVKPNAYRVKTDDLSVNRLSYTTLNYCKRQGVRLDKNSKPAIKEKNFYGIALLFVNEIRNHAKIYYKPILWPIRDINKAHAEIQVGYSTLLSAGQVSSAQYNYATEELAKMARLYIDETNNLKMWKSDNATEILNLKQ